MDELDLSEGLILGHIKSWTSLEETNTLDDGTIEKVWTVTDPEKEGRLMTIKTYQAPVAE